MGNMPESAVDPNGLVPERSSNNYDGFTSFAMGGGALEGRDENGYASEAWFGGGYGGGSGINDINAILSAFGYGGCANIAEWAALKDKIRELNATLEASGIGYRINDKGQFEKTWGVGSMINWSYPSSTGPTNFAAYYFDPKVDIWSAYTDGSSGKFQYKYYMKSNNKNSDKYKGVEFELFIKGVSGYSDLNWIQSVQSNSLYVDFYGNSTYHFNDASHKADAPFYLTKANQDYAYYRATGLHYDFYFKDEPGRPEDYKDNYWFSAELTLMGKRSGIYQPIITFSWGYFKFDDKTIGFGPYVTSPSTFQQSLFPPRP